MDIDEQSERLAWDTELTALMRRLGCRSIMSREAQHKRFMEEQEKRLLAVRVNTVARRTAMCAKLGRLIVSLVSLVSLTVTSLPSIPGAPK